MNFLNSFGAQEITSNAYYLALNEGPVTLHRKMLGQGLFNQETPIVAIIPIGRVQARCEGVFDARKALEKVAKKIQLASKQKSLRT